MKTIKILFLFALTVIGLSSCSSKEDKPLKIVANSWIGYSPLFYAKASGWLEPLNIELSTVVSLGESLHIYKSSNKDAFTGTQYEFSQAYQKDNTLMPIMMFDRSNGGDMVMGNQSVESLKSATSPINVYLEINSINYVVFKDFIKQNKLEDKTFNFINKDQLKIVSAIAEAPNHEPKIAVTYIPYNYSLEKHGFTTLASTRDGLNLLVLDALYTNKESFSLHQEQFKRLKILIDRAIQDLQNDPKLFYDKVNPYLENSSFEEFQSGLQDIVWINQSLSPQLIERLNQAQFPIRDLL
ncbi:ABC transporter substrate-binding protein [Thiomicrorhabdus sp.]|uniref:ABC transporter substrate-binding protein n=1 Tax=Thiomicrorhabdus sp. TaxID=2039724 RepID=UPI003561F450